MVKKIMVHSYNGEEEMTTNSIGLYASKWKDDPILATKSEALAPHEASRSLLHLPFWPVHACTVADT